MSFLIILFSNLQLYFKQYHILAKVNDYILPILIDTGSSISFIQQKYCRFLQILEHPIKVGRCFESNYNIYNSTIVSITFDNLFYFDLALLVQESKDSEIPMLLGVDFLDVLQHYTITYDYLFLTIHNYQLNIPRIMLTQDELNEQLEI